MQLGFSVPVRLTALKLRTPLGALEAGEAPERLRLFFNDPNKSFADAGKSQTLKSRRKYELDSDF